MQSQAPRRFSKRLFFHWALLAGFGLAAPLLEGAVAKAKGQPIFEAVKAGNLDDVKKLLTANPKLAQSKNKLGETALHDAALRGRIEVAKLLLDKKPDVNAKDNSGMTPLATAMVTEKKFLAKLLKAHGAKE